MNMHRVLPAALALLACFLVLSVHLQRESLWLDEGWSLWAVSGTPGARPAPLPTLTGTLRASASAALDTLQATFARVRADVHPPLYFLLLNLWTFAAGDSVFVARLLSAFAALLALAATYAAGRALFNPLTGVLALLLLGTLGFTVYYARDVRMYALVLCLSALALALFVRYQRRAAWSSGIGLALTLAALCWTHYAGALVWGTLAAFGAAERLFAPHPLRGRLTGAGVTLLPLLAAAVLAALWLPFALEQARAHGGRALALALPTDAATLSGLVGVLTSGYPFLLTLPFVLGRALADLRITGTTRRAVALLLACTLLPAVVLLLVNTVIPLYQLRYLVVILPAWALLLAWGLAGLWAGIAPPLSNALARLPAIDRRIGLAVAAFFTLWVLYTQLALYGNYFPDKPRWRDATFSAAAARTPDTPALSNIPPQSPAAYYGSRAGLWNGITLDVGWRPTDAAAVRAHAARLANAPSVWLLMTGDQPATWQALAALLAQGRGVGYRDTVMNTLFYRLDRDADSPPAFTFGADVRYTGGVALPLHAKAGTELCLTLEFTFETTNAGSDLARVAFISGYNTLMMQWEGTLNASTLACVVLPPGTVTARLSVLRADAALPLLEHGLYWGDALTAAVIEVSD